MKLISLKYEEFEKDIKHWKLENISIKDMNLFVGKNATGKTRTTRVIHAIAKIFSGESKTAFESGEYETILTHENEEYIYSLKFQAGKVFKEILKINGVEKLKRGEDGFGEIYFEEEKKNFRFKAQPNEIAIANYQDELQHPFIKKLSEWGENAKLFLFGTNLNQEQMLTHNGIAKIQEKQKKPQMVAEMYVSGYENHKEKFDNAIIQDMNSLGYEVDSVGIEALNNIGYIGSEIYGLTVHEKNLGCKTDQTKMSQGMFRALSLSIVINFLAFSNKRGLFIIDDIGEGLDYARSKDIISLILQKGTTNKMQIIATTNDQFAMNNVPLEFWTILNREGTIVKGHNDQNAAEQFGEFKYMGINNFDFFTSDMFGRK